MASNSRPWVATSSGWRPTAGRRHREDWGDLEGVMEDGWGVCDGQGRDPAGLNLRENLGGVLVQVEMEVTIYIFPDFNLSFGHQIAPP